MALHVRVTADPAQIALLERIAVALESALGGGSGSDEDIENIRAEAARLRKENKELAAAVAAHTPPA